jgi:ribosomal protein L11 methyltransferase
VRRFSLRVPAEQVEPALATMLELFPDGVEQDERDGLVTLSGYAEQAPAEGLEEEPVKDGWEDGWRAFHTPITVAGLWVGPPWFEPEPGLVPIVIDPGRAFGTGAHGSTRAALALLAELEPCSALDLGCGSGVLTIAALRLGFGPLRAYDIDPLAVQATAQNAARNGVEPAEVERRDVLADPLPPAPLWLANLELHLHERLLRRDDLPPLIVASGLLESQTLGGARRVVADGWAAELLAR